MAPTRTPKPGPSSSAAPQKRQKKRFHGPPADAPESAPGVSKLKASIRQTTRLLARAAAPDVRTEAERRLRTLRADLARAEQANKERALAVRYHKIKFFERQKVTRKLKQTKRDLAALPLSPTSKEERKKRKALETQIHTLRVDLNYILHYPKTLKYISLFPPAVRNPESITPEQATEQAKTDAEREELRRSIREQMDAGALSAEPEVEVERREKTERPARSADMGRAKAKATHEEEEEEDAIAGDDFFGEEDGEDSS